MTLAPTLALALALARTLTLTLALPPYEDRLPFYNSMECAKAIAVANGVDASRWHTTEASSAGVEAIGAGTADVAISLLSCGWHYPVTTYAT